MSTLLSGWTPDADARRIASAAPRLEGPQPVTPALFFGTVRVRRRLERGPATAEAIALGLYALTTVPLEDAEATVQAQLDELRRCGLVLSEIRGNCENRRTEHTLTPLGRASLDWRAPPRPPALELRHWAGMVASAISTAHKINHHAMLVASCPGPEVVRARGRLADVLHAEGWTWEVIERHFGMRRGSAEPAAEVWRRSLEAQKATDSADQRIGRMVPRVAAHAARIDAIYKDALERGDPGRAAIPPAFGERCKAVDCQPNPNIAIDGGFCALHAQRKRLGLHVEEVER